MSKRAHRAVIYTRVSTQEQAENNTSLADQQAICRRKAEALGMPVIAHHEDAGLSGALYDERLGLQGALAAIERGDADTLIVATLDRLSRDRLHQSLVVQRIKAAEARIIYCNLDINDSEESELQVGILGDFAVYERHMFRKRSMTGRARLATEGLTPAVSPPFGYIIPTKADVLRGTYPPETRGRYLIHPEQAPVVERIFLAIAGGDSLWNVSRTLNAEGVATSRGGIWRPALVHRMLNNPAYKGMAKYGRTKVIHDPSRALSGFRKFRYADVPEDLQITIPCPAIIDDATWDTCQRVLAANREIKSGRPSRVHLLSGLVRCPKCGFIMRSAMGTTSLRDKNGVRYKKTRYHCKNAAPAMSTDGHVCHSKIYYGKTLEAKVLKALWSLSESPDVVAKIMDAERPDAGAAAIDIDAMETRLAMLAKQESATAKAQVAGIMSGADPATYDTMLREIAGKRRELIDALRAARARLQAVARADSGALEVTAALREMRVYFETEGDVAARRDAIKAIVESITPRPDGGLDIKFRG